MFFYGNKLIQTPKEIKEQRKRLRRNVTLIKTYKGGIRKERRCGMSPNYPHANWRIYQSHSECMKFVNSIALPRENYHLTHFKQVINGKLVNLILLEWYLNKY